MHQHVPPAASLSHGKLRQRRQLLGRREPRWHQRSDVRPKVDVRGLDGDVRDPADPGHLVHAGVLRCLCRSTNSIIEWLVLMTAPEG